MPLQAGDRRAPYLQIADHLRTAIADGTYPPGERLPSARELKDQYEVSIATIQSAFNVLHAEGLTYSVHGKGTFVLSATGQPATEGHGRPPPSPEYVALRTQIDALAQEVDDLRQIVTDLVRSASQG